MHMAAVATLASNILDSKAFYVIKPADGEAVMPNKQVIELPTLISLKTAMALKPMDVSIMMEPAQFTYQRSRRGRSLKRLARATHSTADLLPPLPKGNCRLMQSDLEQ